MEFKKGNVEGVIAKSLKKYTDERGWLVELFRHDELISSLYPVMAYASITQPGITRGPHEHREQTDFFAFIGPSNFLIYLWDNRKASSSYKNKQTIRVGQDSPHSIIIPPGVVHAYKNIGTQPGLVFNAPNKLFAGKNKKEPVDEIRHEDDPNSPFIIN